MNKVIGMLAVVAFASSMASAELLKNFKADGSVEAVGVVVQNRADFDKKAADKFGDVKNRVIVNATFDLNEDVNAVVTAVKCDRSYGQPSQTVAGGTADSFTFEQAYLNLKNVIGLNHKVGRQFYGNDGDIVLYYGPANWYTRGLGVSTLDAWTATWNKNKLTVNGLTAKVSETAAPAIGTVGALNDDKDLYGLTASYDYSDVVKPAAYFYQYRDNTVASKPNNLEVFGLKANGKYSGLEYGLEYAMNMGTNQNLTPTTNMDYKGSALKVNAAYGGLEMAGKLGFTGEFAMGSGDKKTTDKTDKSFQDIAANYRPGLIAGGIGVNNGAVVLTVTDLNDLTTWNLGANWTPSMAEKLNIEAKYYSYSPTETKVDGVKLGYTTYGTEFDLCANWKHSESVGLKAYYATLAFNKKFVETMNGVGAKKDAVSLLGIAMNVKF
ncbi:MAG: hypothetical protein A2X34_01990 [Elusimicrobia bacterium GWC2_51_8]|nr:MAG: hypothetical protein A2X33_10480 [Elusimicrobia bacterium GWA2_51_34]OGR57871.1 MAG: hypothetical protein A2X34_01990 [Elusimicrobia bacterium GWC2_51_8]HCE98374.1 hypothetical protein [Elusimicrobiota bacterium]